MTEFSLTHMAMALEAMTVPESLDAMTWPAGEMPGTWLPEPGDIVELGPAAGFPDDMRPFSFKVDRAQSAGPEWAYLWGHQTDDGPRQQYMVRLSGITVAERPA